MRSVLSAVALVLAVGACSEGKGAGPPNVLLLVMDTTRADRCSVTGYDRPTTPRLEALAREGVVYRDAWSPSSWTAPAHASLFTGLRPEHHGLLADNRPFLLESETTLAERFADAGYFTACITNNTFVSQRFGLTQGFTAYEFCMDPRGPGRISAVWAHERALARIDGIRELGDPFFVFVNDMEPHMPYRPEKETARRFLPPDVPEDRIRTALEFDNDESWDYVFDITEMDDALWGVISDHYDAEIADLDGWIGDLLDGLEERDLLDDTIVVILGDHGENLGEHHLSDHLFSLHRTLLHVPLVIRWPRAFEPGTVVDRVVRVEDVYPTLLELAGLDRGDPAAEKRIDGVSLLADTGPRLARATYGRQPAHIYEEVCPDYPSTPFASGIRSVYDGRWHLLAYTDGRESLFDVRADPGERTDLAATDPEGVLERLRSELPRR